MHGRHAAWWKVELVSDLLYEISRNKRDSCEISRKTRLAV